MVESEDEGITLRGDEVPPELEEEISIEEGRKRAKRLVKINVEENLMVPKHEIVSEEEKNELIRRYGPLELFPKMLASDPMVERLGAKPGDLIRIHREEGIYYRYVVGERRY